MQQKEKSEKLKCKYYLYQMTLNRLLTELKYSPGHICTNQSSVFRPCAQGWPACMLPPSHPKLAGSHPLATETSIKSQAPCIQIIKKEKFSIKFPACTLRRTPRTITFISRATQQEWTQGGKQEGPVSCQETASVFNAARAMEFNRESLYT